MNETIDIKRQIKDLIKEYYSGTESKTEFVPGRTRIPLVAPSYDWEEVCEAIDCLLDAQVTMGEKVEQFESMFAEYIGTRFATMVNSGSSANLLALSILTNPLFEKRIKPGDEVITPAVTWATTVFPIINCGLVPVLVDVDLETFNMNTEEIKKAVTDKTRAIMPVHLLGNPCEMDRIMNIAMEYNLYVIEDACEAHGAEFRGRKVGSFGDLATFSFFFSHHISTIEGGMVLTNNEKLAELAKALRVFGWIRELKDKDKIALEYEDIDPRYLFVNTGFNFRPTEIQGAFGIHQIKKLDKFIEIRRENVEFWAENLKQYKDHLLLHIEREDTKHVWFAYPITVKPDAPFSRKELVDFLEEKGVETRPIMSGNFDEQPAMRLFPYRKVGDLPNSRLIMRNSFFFGNHPGIIQEEREAIVNYFKEFMKGV
ncbi:MAG: GDP-4-keto-6-deoxy-D-mannose-3-dehydratase / pyridoxamine-phosphate transaminase [Firmicutes bacterium]|nr:GDP-4-keto-6-deoxy-D-mannose-3-dehydratase / pyridoxamine-phosphate transaminase [Bacillota bacterium]